MQRRFVLSSIFVVAGALSAWAAECSQTGSFGGITVETKDGKCVATISSDDTSKIEIPDVISVDAIEYDRVLSSSWTKTGNSTFTAVFPFAARISGANIAELDSVDNAWGYWAVHAHNIDTKLIEANVPYLIIPEGSQMTFSEVSTLQTSDDLTISLGQDTPWEFHGTYSYKKWEEGDSQLGRVYGFAAKETDGFQKGQFVKAKAGAFIKPMRAYLLYNKKSASTFAKSGALAKVAADDEDLPQTLSLVITDKDGAVASIGQINAVTGTVSVEGWFDMKGRKLNKKPTLPGTYFNNGEKVIIK